MDAFERWAAFWSSWVGGIFLGGYLGVAANADFLPRCAQDTKSLLEVFLLEKALAETATELADRPDWAIIPLRGIQSILGR